MRREYQNDRTHDDAVHRTPLLRLCTPRSSLLSLSSEVRSKVVGASTRDPAACTIGKSTTRTANVCGPRRAAPQRDDLAYIIAVRAARVLELFQEHQLMLGQAPGPFGSFLSR